MSAVYYPTKVTVTAAPRCCPVCAKKWMRQLWAGQCICTGHVQPSLPVPGGPQERHRFTPVKVVLEVDQHAAVREELHIPQEKNIKRMQKKIDAYKAAMAKKPKD